MLSFYDLIQGEGDVQNCTASYWSLLFNLLSYNDTHGDYEYMQIGSTLVVQ